MTTKCSQLKMTASDGKRYATDCLAQDDIMDLIKALPGKGKNAFLDWLPYSDNSIDGQSRRKAYDLFDNGLLDNEDVGTVKALKQIHAYLFGGLYDFAGQIRNVNISKDGFTFASAEFLPNTLRQIEAMVFRGNISGYAMQAAAVAGSVVVIYLGVVLIRYKMDQKTAQEMTDQLKVFQNKVIT